MTLTELEARSARQRAIENMTLEELDAATEAVNSTPMDYCSFHVEMAYLMGVVDGKRAERARKANK